MYGLYKPRPCQCSLKIKCVTVRGVSEFLLRVPIDRQLLKYPIKQQDKTSKTRPLGPSDYEATSPEQRARRSRPPTPSKVAFAQLWPITFNGTVANKWLHECQQNNCTVKNQWHTKATVKPHRWGECHYIPPPPTAGLTAAVELYMTQDSTTADWDTISERKTLNKNILCTKSECLDTW